MENYFRRCQINNIPEGLAQHIRGALEDGRVNRCQVNDDPGSVKTLRWLIEVIYRYGNLLVGDMDLKSQVLNSLLQRAINGKDLKGIEPKAMEILDSIQEYIDAGVWAKSCKEMLDKAAYPIAEALTKALGLEVGDRVETIEIKITAKESTGRGMEAPDGDFDPRVSRPKSEGEEGEPEKTSKGKKPSEKSEPKGDSSERTDGTGGEDEKEAGSAGGPSFDDAFDPECASDLGDSDGFADPGGDDAARSCDAEVGEAEFRDLFRSMGDELAAADKEEVDVLAAKARAMEASGESDFERLPPAVVTKILSKGIHAECEYYEVTAERDGAGHGECQRNYETALAIAEPYIETWLEIIQERLDHKFNAPRNGLRSGMLDIRRMHRAVSVKDTRVFTRRLIESDDADAAVYVLVDDSGSMTNGNRCQNAMVTAITLAHTLEQLGIAHTVASFTDDTKGSRVCVKFTRLVDWGEADKSGIGVIRGQDSNRDGYAIRVAAQELSKRPEKAKLLFVLSDGQPSSGFGYYDSVATEDTKAAVEGARDLGLKVMGFYFGDTSPDTLKAALHMYGNGLVVARKVGDLVIQVADAMDEELQRIL